MSDKRRKIAPGSLKLTAQCVTCGMLPDGARAHINGMDRTSNEQVCLGLAPAGALTEIDGLKPAAELASLMGDTWQPWFLLSDQAVVHASERAILLQRQTDQPHLTRVLCWWRGELVVTSFHHQVGSWTGGHYYPQATQPDKAGGPAACGFVFARALEKYLED